jgi:hypothetical protein
MVVGVAGMAILVVRRDVVTKRVAWTLNAAPAKQAGTAPAG